MQSAFGSAGVPEGVGITPARCEGVAFMVNGGGVTRVAEDGEVFRNSAEGVFRVKPDGTGFASAGGDVVRVRPDGSVFVNGAAEVDGSKAVLEIKPDGGGFYSGRLGTIRLNGHGEGFWNGPQGTIRINADGSGFWSGPQGTVRVNADGSGFWSGEHGVIRNDGKGKGYWSRLQSQDVPMDPVPPVPPAGRFPQMKGFAMPGRPCGFIISVADRVLFDFDKSSLRSEAGATLGGLARALQPVQVRSIEVRGHTDSHGEAAYNEALSTRRAQAVLEGLRTQGVAGPIRAQGFGESQPVAPNAIKGVDNPSGRQLNRRVEIFVGT